MNYFIAPADRRCETAQTAQLLLDLEILQAGGVEQDAQLTGTAVGFFKAAQHSRAHGVTSAPLQEVLQPCNDCPVPLSQQPHCTQAQFVGGVLTGIKNR